MMKDVIEEDVVKTNASQDIIMCIRNKKVAHSIAYKRVKTSACFQLLGVPSVSGLLYSPCTFNKQKHVLQQF